MDNPAFLEQSRKEFEEATNDKSHKNGKTLQTVPLADTYTFEEAISMTECGKFHYQILLTGGLCFMTVISQVVCTSVILPAVKCDIPATLEQQGLLGAAGFFGVVCSSHAMGFLGDTWGRARTLKWSLILGTIASIISAFSVNIWMLIAFRCLTGVFSAGCQACVFSFCSEFHSTKTRGRHVTLISVFLSLAVIYVPFEALIILPLQTDFTIFGMVMSPWRLLLLAVNLSSTVALVLLFFTPETPKYELIHGKHDSALNTMRAMFTRNTGRPVEEYPVKHIELEMTGANIADIHSVKDAVKMVWNQTIPLFYKERILHTLNICLILFMTYGIPHGLLMWYPTIMNDEIKRDGEDLCQVISEVNILEAENSDYCSGNVEKLTFWLVIFIGTTFTVGYLVFAFTVDILGKRNIIIFWLILCGLCGVAVPYISSFPLAVLTLTLICAAGNIGGIVGTIACEFFPTNINAMAMCFVMMVGRLGAVVGSNIFGYFIFANCNLSFWIIGGILILMAGMCWLLPEKKRDNVKCIDDAA